MAVTEPMSKEEMDKLPMPERYIVSKCHQLVADVTQQLEEYTMGQAGDQIQTFLWDQFADWYLETSKTRIFAAQKSDDPDVQAAAAQARRVLLYVLDTNLRLLHPFMPFVTEAIWQRLPHKGPSLVIASWPQPDTETLHVDTEAVTQFSSVQELVRMIRNTRNEYKVEPGRKIAINIAAEGPLRQQLQAEAAAIATFVKADEDALHIQSLEETLAGMAGDEVSSCSHHVGRRRVARLPPSARRLSSSRWRSSRPGSGPRLFSTNFACCRMRGPRVPLDARASARTQARRPSAAQPLTSVLDVDKSLGHQRRASRARPCLAAECWG